MTRYTVCLPRDLEDPKEQGKRFWRDRWHEWKIKQERWAARKGRKIVIDYWGESDVWHRLSAEENAGRLYYWFNGEVLSRAWLLRKFEDISASIHGSYHPTLNVDTPPARYVDALGLRPAFFHRVDEVVAGVRKAYHYLETWHSPSHSFEPLRVLSIAYERFSDAFAHLNATTFDGQDASVAVDATNDLARACELTIEALEAASRATSADADDGTRSTSKRTSLPQSSDYYRLASRLTTAVEFLESDEWRAGTARVLLVRGEAGTGKTHLLRHCAERRLAEGLPTVLLLGRQFADRPALSQLPDLVDLNCKGEEFLGALDAAGEAADAPVLLMIDALNEGRGLTFWPNYLPSLMVACARYPRIRLVISVRSPLEAIVLPKLPEGPNLVQVKHEGFAGVEYSAVKKYFQHYRVSLPDSPLLLPEYQNPLFLLTLCEGLRDAGKTSVPRGMEGITAILEFRIESLHERLWKPAALDYPREQNMVRRAVSVLAERMAALRLRDLDFDEARDLVNGLMPRAEESRSLFRALLEHDLLAEEQRLTRVQGKLEHRIRFTYDRFTDHLIVAHLLNDYHSRSDITSALRPGGPLCAALHDSMSLWSLSESLAVQLPERFGVELWDAMMVKEITGWSRHALLESLVWRKDTSITQRTIELIAEHLTGTLEDHDALRDCLLSLAMRPHHPLNADFLHSRLVAMSLPQRDGDWTPFFSDNYEEQDDGAIRRLIDWAWTEDDKSHIAPEALRLAGVVLAWLFASNNRELRDRATKACVCLFQHNPGEFARVLEAFRDVNDPYVAERLCAVAYGVVLRTSSARGTGQLAATVYDLVFRDGTPPPHILLRDYARWTVEHALRTGALEATNIVHANLHPPYGGEWPSPIPSREELRARCGKRGHCPQWLDNVQDSLWGVVGDFGLYIIGTNSNYAEHTCSRLRDLEVMTPDEMFLSYYAGLSRQQKLGLHAYTTSEAGSVVNWGTYRDEPGENEKAFLVMLNPDQRGRFEEFVVPYLLSLTGGLYSSRKFTHFNLGLLQRWIFQRVIELGGTDQFHRRSDHLPQYVGRQVKRIERIGKKYQWIALHEAMGLLCDNFELRPEDDEQAKTYAGPWQLGRMRNIDPTMLLREPPSSRGFAVDHVPRYYDISQPDFNAPVPDTEWVGRRTGFTSPATLVKVRHPKDNSAWLRLSGYLPLSDPILPGEGFTDSHHRQVNYLIDSFVVRQTDAQRLMEWIMHLHENEPHPNGDRQVSKVFLREIAWHDAFRYSQGANADADGWQPVDFRQTTDLRAVPTTLHYSIEAFQYDFSLGGGDGAISLPNAWLIRHMKLRHGPSDTCWIDAAGDVAAFDPILEDGSSRSLLVREDLLADALAREGCTIVWGITAFKEVWPGRGAKDEWHGQHIAKSALAYSPGLSQCVKWRFHYRSPSRPVPEIDFDPLELLMSQQIEPPQTSNPPHDRAKRKRVRSRRKNR